MQRKHLFLSLCLVLGFTGAFASGPGPLPFSKDVHYSSPAQITVAKNANAPCSTFAFYGINGIGQDMNVLVTNTSTYASSFYVLPALSYSRTFLGNLEPGYYNIQISTAVFPQFFNYYVSGQSGLASGGGTVYNAILNVSNDQLVTAF